MMIEKKLKVEHEVCIHCGLCVMMGFAYARDGKKYIKPDLAHKDFAQAERCCPVGAIVFEKEENRQSAAGLSDS